MLFVMLKTVIIQNGNFFNDFCLLEIHERANSDNINYNK